MGFVGSGLLLASGISCIFVSGASSPLSAFVRGCLEFLPRFLCLDVCAVDIRDVEPMRRMISFKHLCTAHSLCSSEGDISLRSALSPVARDRLGHRSCAAETPFSVEERM